MSRFVEVAVALPVRGTFHYSVPMDLGTRPLLGSRVLARFGNRGVSGVVVGESGAVPDGVGDIRDIEGVLDGPPLNKELLELCRWVAAYYEAPLGEVLRAALPAGSRVKATKQLLLTPAGEAAVSGGALPRRRNQILAAVAAAGGSLPPKAFRGAQKELAALVDEGLLRLVLAAARPRVSERKVRVAKLARALDDAGRAELRRAPKRLALIEALHEAGGELEWPALLARDATCAAKLRALASAGWVELFERAVATPLAPAAVGGAVGTAAVMPPTLTDAQSGALAEIVSGIDSGEFHAYLLHGITGSGKTEVYLHAIADALARGKNALVLVPEISLTPQLAARFRARFGDEVAVLHSGLTDRERFDEWHRLSRGEARIALGARSAVFAPVPNLGIAVIDEEHDSSFKQEEGVRYHGRDVALVRAQRAGAVCVLGSATPALESFHGAKSGRYRLLELPNRATDAKLPDVELVDLRRYGPDPDTFLTAPLAAAVGEALERGEQTILFLNRRGFHTFVLCTGCGHQFRCPDCSVSLTYHQHRESLTCHYCGHREHPPTTCPSCGADKISKRGLGTERVATAIAEAFPTARVARLDRDVGGSKGVQDVLERMGRGEVDILVGTQMVTKGHDFPGVTLVGVLCADTGLSLPDFRASERTFQLLTQVAGRAGRGDRPGRVFIQSYRVESPAVACAQKHDYHEFAAGELDARRDLGYPPFGHLVAIRIDGSDGGQVRAEATRIAVAAESGGVREAGVTVLGPCEAPLARLKGRTRWHLWFSAPTRAPLRQLLRLLDVESPQTASGVRVSVDVDPNSTL